MTDPATSAVGIDLLPSGVTTNGTQRRLLTTAVEMFAARGYHGVSVRDLTARMGLRPSSLYAHYASKEQLFSELVFLANDEIQNRLMATLLAAGQDPAVQLAELVRAYVTFHAEYPLLATIGHNDLHVLSEESLHRVTKTRRDSSGLLLAVIERGNAAGVFHSDEPWLAVAAIASLGIRLASWYRAPDHAPELQGEGYAADVLGWMPHYDVHAVGEAYAGFALALVRHSPTT